MTLMESLITTTTPSPPKMIVYGQPGVGKTSFAASAQALLIDCENGAGQIPSLKRTPYLETWLQMRQWLAEVADAPKIPAPVLAIDTLDWMIQRITEFVTIDLDGKKPADVTNTIGSSHGGYYKAREVVQNIVYRDLLPMLNRIASRGVAIILLAHAANTKMTSPEGFDIRLAGPDIPNWILPPFIEWADAVLYASRDGEQRVLRAEGTNVILAKNRYSLPAELPLSWQGFVNAMTSNPTNTANRKAQTNG